MIKFFRRVRQQLLSQNRFSKYLLYAIGEIVLVVIGILIALQVNDWNEKKKQRIQIKTYLTALHDELVKDTIEINKVRYQANQILVRIDSLTGYVERYGITNISNLDLICLTWMNAYRPYIWNRATIDELKSSGSLKLIQNKNISNRIMAYEARTKHLEEDYNTDKNQADLAQQPLMSMINTKFSGAKSLLEIVRSTSNNGTIHDIFSSDEYLQAEKLNINYLKFDSIKLNLAINNLVKHRFNIRIRTEIELPEIIASAKELLLLLEKEIN